MNNKVLKIYIYPLLTIILSIIPWYLLTKFVLKIDFDSFLYQALECKTGTCVRNFKIFCISVLTLVYLFWVGFSIWLEKAPNEKEKVERAHKFFLSYGKTIVVIVVLEFALIVLFIGIGII